MQKQTAFYVASAAFAATILFTDDKASAASIVVQDGYQLLEKQNTVQTFDLAKEQTTRTINFSLPVDATTVKANDNIVLFDVTASEKVTVTAKVASNKTSVDVKLAEGVTYKEGHEYRLLIGNTIKNVATKTESLKQAIQFNYKTINVTAPPVAKPEGEQAANGTLSGTISSITASNVTIGDKSYSMS
ncbi:MAG: hypothetical protein UHX00_07280, partial [Caryophanon sp.]|nr:hypothetical protein [Caryophanon sp.]